MQGSPLWLIPSHVRLKTKLERGAQSKVNIGHTLLIKTDFSISSIPKVRSLESMPICSVRYYNIPLIYIRNMSYVWKESCAAVHTLACSIKIQFAKKKMQLRSWGTDKDFAHRRDCLAKVHRAAEGCFVPAVWRRACGDEEPVRQVGCALSAPRLSPLNPKRRWVMRTHPCMDAQSINDRRPGHHFRSIKLLFPEI